MGYPPPAVKEPMPEPAGGPGTWRLAAAANHSHDETGHPVMTLGASLGYCWSAVGTPDSGAVLAAARPATICNKRDRMESCDRMGWCRDGRRRLEPADR